MTKPTPQPSEKVKTTYGVYIIESNELHYRDGEKLREILDLIEFPCRYQPVGTLSEFSNAIDEFSKSGFRYLHLSCHADMDGIQIKDSLIDNKDLIPICKGKLSRKRVFLSACRASNLRLATVLIQKCGAQSIIGSPQDLHFITAATLWPAFYHKVQELDKQSLNQKSLTRILRTCVNFFGIPINYYHQSKKQNRLVRTKFRKRFKPDRQRIKFAETI